MDSFPPFSHRADPSVPAFPDEGCVAFMDGACGLCSRGARAIARYDRRHEFRIATVQSPLGRAVLIHYGLDPDDPSTWLLLENGTAYSSLDAAIRTARRLRGPWLLFLPFALLPKPLRDRLYRLVARNRYRLMGRAELCALPDPELRARLIE